MFPSLKRLVPLSLVLVSGMAQPLLAQDSLQKVKDLYSSAAYEDTLTAISSLPPSEPKPEVEQYRIFSLVALGRVAEAEQAVEAVLTAHPRYHPEDGDASPRIQELFAKVRKRIGPDAVKGMYIEAKAALDKKDRENAVSLFEEMLRIADDPDIKDQPPVGELKLLGSGFLELSRALPASASAPGSAGTPAAGGAPGAAPGTPAAPVAVIDSVAVREVLPPWLPANSADRREYEGTLRVHITEKGAVESAEMVKPVHPAYDGLLLKAARDWVYQPARVNGVPIPSTKEVLVRLKPPAR
jgi:TonB family protein